MVYFERLEEKSWFIRATLVYVHPPEDEVKAQVFVIIIILADIIVIVTVVIILIIINIIIISINIIINSGIISFRHCASS